ncbi:ornithine carbamoyltransferase [Corallincola luteus]|uniref:Ornithine carbamoyltransferase n=1 Tax=Corallincola luteus TaxID=1775177 RepID=A0ABY2AMS2_9GAMM|nr:ornithine carbamoyltransferase [Corallincola luteus]TCI04504.1 ornithine carbamoyltransferase [Corallincola luteus]
MKPLNHLLTLKDLDKEQILHLLDQAAKIKAAPQDYANALRGKSVVMLFEKPSLRTRVSFDIGLNKMGGHAVYLDQQNGELGARETVKDFGANISCWADGIVARVFKQSTLEQLATGGSIPVINALSDLYHPCQALADFLALQEKLGDPSKVKLAYVGDGNNVTHSLMLLAAQIGAEMVVVCPPGYSVDGQVVVDCQAINARTGGKLTISSELSALNGVDAIYADTWVSMGDSTPLDQIKAVFSSYQINAELMASTGAKFFMHCQPAHREYEVTSEVLDGEQSLILPQAENRMWAQNSVMLELLK